MNNRIKELERQADEYADGLGLAGDEWCDAQSTKFAELIVKECAKIAKQTDADDGDDYKSGRSWAGIDILKHFGVEE